MHLMALEPSSSVSALAANSMKPGYRRAVPMPVSDAEYH